MKSILAFVTTLFLLPSSVSTTEVTQFRDQCYPCTAYKYKYCADAEILVNLNRDKCYTTLADKGEYCKDFDLYKNNLLCSDISLSSSKACDIFKGKEMIFNQPIEGELELEPRSSCGFYVYQYSGYVQMFHQFPMMFY